MQRIGRLSPDVLLCLFAGAAARFQVHLKPETLRPASVRSKKTGKAPQKVLQGQYERGSLPRRTTPSHRERPVKQTT